MRVKIHYVKTNKWQCCSECGACLERTPENFALVGTFDIWHRMYLRNVCLDCFPEYSRQLQVIERTVGVVV